MKKSCNRYPILFYYTPVILWGIFISWATLTPGNQLPKSFHSLNDKFVHSLIFFAAAALIILGQIRFELKRSLTFWQAWLVWFITLLHGALIELGQHFFVPGRYGDWFDLLYDIIGASAALLLWYIFQFLRKR